MVGWLAGRRGKKRLLTVRYVAGLDREKLPKGTLGKYVYLARRGFAKTSQMRPAAETIRSAILTGDRSGWCEKLVLRIARREMKVVTSWDMARRERLGRRVWTAGTRDGCAKQQSESRGHLLFLPRGSRKWPSLLMAVGRLGFLILDRSCPPGKLAARLVAITRCLGVSRSY